VISPLSIISIILNQNINIGLKEQLYTQIIYTYPYIISILPKNIPMPMPPPMRHHDLADLSGDADPKSGAYAARCRAVGPFGWGLEVGNPWESMGYPWDIHGIIMKHRHMNGIFFGIFFGNIY
jgi:hypothetical protein